MAKKSVTKVAAKTVKKAPVKTAAKPAAKAPAKTKAVAKPAAKAPVKTKAVAKPAAKVPAKTKAKVPAKTKAVPSKAPSKGKVADTKSKYVTMKVAELREILESREMDSKGTRPVLIARLQEEDTKEPEEAEEEPEEEEPEEEAEEEPEEEVEEEAEEVEEGESREIYGEIESDDEVSEEEEEKPAPTKSKKVVAKPKEKVPVPKALPKALPKPPTKVTKVIEKEVLKLTVPKNITNSLYKIDAKTLTALIVKSFNENQGDLFKSLFTELEDYVATNLPEDPRKPKPKPDLRKLVISFDESYGGYTNPEGTFLIHPETLHIFAKIVDGNIVTLENEDLENIVGYRISMPRDMLPTSKDIDIFLVESLEIYNKKKPADIPKILKKVEKKVEQKKEDKKAGPKVATKKETKEEETEEAAEEETEEAEEENEEEGEEEGKDDGEEAVIEEEDEKEEDVIDQLNKEEEELIRPSPEITEEVFYKFLQAFHSGSKTDHVAIAKKAGLEIEVAEEILLKYRFLVDKYPQAVSNEAMARRSQIPPKPAFGTRKTQVKPKTGQQRLIK